MNSKIMFQAARSLKSVFFLENKEWLVALQGDEPKNETTGASRQLTDVELAYIFVHQYLLEGPRSVQEIKKGAKDLLSDQIQWQFSWGPIYRNEEILRWVTISLFPPSAVDEFLQTNHGLTIRERHGDTYLMYEEDADAFSSLN